MSSTQLTEHETNAALPASKPQPDLPAPEKPKGSGARKWIVVLVILLAVGAAVWKIRKNMQEQVSQGQRMTAMADRATPVQTISVQQRTMPIYLTALGTVTAYNTVTIKTRVDGQLMRVNVQEGQAVKQGQLLVEIDPKPYEAALAQAEGQLAKDQATSANDQAQAARYKALYQAGVVSQENAQAQQATAGQSSGLLRSDEAAIQAAKVNLGYTRIVSPINGVVGLRQVDAGNIVHSSDANGLLLITQLQPIAVIFTLPEDHLPEVLKLTREGRKLAVEAYDRSGTTHLASGSLLTVDNQIDPTTGTVKAKAIFDNKDGALFPNQFVNVRLILQERPNAIVIPSAALQTGSQGNFVYLVKPGDPPAETQGGDGNAAGAGNKPGRGTGKRAGAGAGATGQGAAGAGQNQNAPHFYAEARTVEVELTEGSQVILNGGVNPGDQIVIDGQEKLRNGSRVIPRQANTPPAGGGNRGIGAAPQGSTAARPSSSAETPANGRAGRNAGGRNGGGNGGQRP